MTQYVLILHATLAVNVLAIAHRCRLHQRLAVLVRQRRCWSDLEDGCRGGCGCGTVNGTTDDCPSLVRKKHLRLLYCVYMPVYLCAVCADWLQGPYKYAVYSAYGYDQRAISFLFVAGFGSGMSLGSIIGGLADSLGRKRMVCWYCVTYALSCLAKHLRPFWALLLGRVLGGIATSLLFSVFDAWLIRAHAARGIDASYLSQSFSAANFGSSLVAILAGLVANMAVGTTADGGPKSSLQPMFDKAARRWMIEEAAQSLHGEESVGPPLSVDDKRWDVAWVYVGGGIAAFDLALIPLALCFVLVTLFWEENYGEESGSSGEPAAPLRTRRKKGWGGVMFAALSNTSRTVWHSSGIFNLCAVTSFFEGAMYVFILLWTPALRALDVHVDVEDYPGPPLGVVFATFMVCCMLGTSIFSIVTSMGMRPSRFLVGILAISSASCLVMANTSNDTLSYSAMLAFEFCIGGYYPAMSTVKGSIIPEDQRAAIYSIFRLPLNLVVLLNLFSQLEFKESFGVCTAMLSVATLLQIRVVRWEAGARGISPLKTMKLSFTNRNEPQEVDEKMTSRDGPSSPSAIKRRHVRNRSSDSYNSVDIANDRIVRGS